MPLWTILYFWLYWPLLAITVAIALRWGGRDAKAAAVPLLVASCCEMLVQSRPSIVFAHVEPGILAVDLCYLVALTVIAIRIAARWLYCAAAVQLLSVLGHVAKLLDPAMSRLAYAIMTGSGYVEIALIIFAVTVHAMTVRRRAAGTPPGR